jgi:hypothetical protein
MDEADRLRKLAAWYREFAERAGEPWIWEARLQTADELEHEATVLEHGLTKNPTTPRAARRIGAMRE